MIEKLHEMVSFPQRITVTVVLSPDVWKCKLESPIRIYIRTDMIYINIYSLYWYIVRDSLDMLGVL